MLWFLLLLTPQSLVSAPPAEPRDPLISLQSLPSRSARLAAVETLLAERIESDPDGIHYLYGHLLEATGKEREAGQAFAESIAYTPLLEQHSRLRLARLEARRGHPEVTAGLTASILRGTPDPSLITEATRRLVAAVRAGGDCRLLDLETTALPDRERRDLIVARAECRQPEQIEEARAALLALLAEDESDDAARRAANWLLRNPGPPLSREETLRLGTTFHHHRQFDLSISTLTPLVAALPAAIQHRADYDLLYLHARSFFWREEFVRAARIFDDLALRTDDPKRKARALYQAGRALELSGSWPEARRRFAAVAEITPSNNFTGPAILAAFRLDWRRGQEAEALGTYATLRSRATWNQYSGQAAIFLVASDIVQGRVDRAGAWLTQAANLKVDRPTLHYWQGRLAEHRDDPAGAAREYKSLLQAAPYHPLAIEAGRRLTTDPELVAAADRDIAIAGRATSLEERLAAWHLARLSRNEPTRRDLVPSIYQGLTRLRTTAPFLSLAAAPVPTWPLWSRSMTRVEERLLSLGRWDEVELSPILRLFPTREPTLAFAAAENLGRVGATRKSLYVAEALRRRVPKLLPEPMLPVPFRRLLFPVPYREPLHDATGEHGVSPHLLLAIMREESRFDPYALSAAAARGLTQFVLPTANRIAASLDLPTPIDPDALYEPRVAITLGAAYLAELDREFDGRRPLTVAAYNAGEYQARLWSAYCFSEDDGEYFSKVGFKETRAYLERVLGSEAQYSELYPTLGD